MGKASAKNHLDVFTDKVSCLFARSKINISVPDSSELRLHLSAFVADEIAFNDYFPESENDDYEALYDEVYNSAVEAVRV